MKCNHCNAEWTLPTTRTFDKCPFCGNVLTQTINTASVEKKGFASTLVVKTEQQLADEHARAYRRRVQDNIEWVLRFCKSDCQSKSDHGERKLSKDYSFLSCMDLRGKDKRQFCEEVAEGVKLELLKEGFHNVRTKLKRKRGFDDYDYRVHVICE